jgi:hypothetical protein
MVAKDEFLAYGITVCFGVPLLILLVYLSFGKKQKKLPPGPFPWPVIGNLFLGGPHPHQVFTQLARRYGNIMTLYFGSVRVLVVSDASMSKELFSVSDANFASRPIHDLMSTTSKYMNYGEENVSIMSSFYTPKVREMRQLIISELFTTQKLEMKKSTRMEEIRRMVAAMTGGITKSPVDVRDTVSELSLRINCRMTFNKAFLNSGGVPGSSSGSGLDPQAYRNLEAENIKLLATHNNQDMIPCLRILFGRFDVDGIHAKWKDVTARKVSCAENILEWYRQRGSAPVSEESEIDFVETLLRLTNSGKYTVTIARSMILVSFLIARVLDAK